MILHLLIELSVIFTYIRMVVTWIYFDCYRVKQVVVNRIIIHRIESLIQLYDYFQLKFFLNI